jgi:hypothetical protein
MAEQPTYPSYPSAPPRATSNRPGMQETVFGAIAAVTGVGFVATLGLGIAAPALAEKPVELRLAFKPGQTQTFTLHQSSTGSATLPDGSVQPESTDLTGSELLKVKSIDAAGVVSVDETVTIIKETLNGKPAPASATQPVHAQLLVHPDGHVTGDGGESNITSSAAGSTQFTVILPTGPVRTGDTWTRKYETPLFTGVDVGYTATSKLLGYKDVNGTKAASVQTDYSAPLDVTVDAKKAAGFAQVGLPAGTSLHIVGTATGRQTGDIDVSGQRLLDSTESDNITMTISFLGLSGPTATLLAKGIKLTSKETTQLY